MIESGPVLPKKQLEVLNLKPLYYRLKPSNCFCFYNARLEMTGRGAVHARLFHPDRIITTGLMIAVTIGGCFAGGGYTLGLKANPDYVEQNEN